MEQFMKDLASIIRAEDSKLVARRMLHQYLIDNQDLTADTLYEILYHINEH